MGSPAMPLPPLKPEASVGLSGIGTRCRQRRRPNQLRHQKRLSAILKTQNYQSQFEKNRTKRIFLLTLLGPPFRGGPMTGDIKHLQIQANGISLHVAVSGPPDAPPILCLHGYPEGWLLWRSTMRELSEYRVC